MKQTRPASNDDILVVVGFLFVVPLLLVAPVLAGAQPAETASFQPIGAYELEIGGNRTPSRFYHSKSSGTILVEVVDLARILEIEPRARSIKTYSAVHFSSNPDGSRDRRSDASPISSSSFQLRDGLPEFEVDGKVGRLRLKPPLLGPFDYDGLVESNPAYGERAAGYRPSSYHLDRIGQNTDEIEVVVFFGSWCAVCDRLMPNVLRVEQALRESKVTFRYHGLPQGFDDQEAKRLGVSSVPTAIIYRDGDEIQRFTGYNLKLPDMAIANALSGTPSLGQ